MGTNYYVKTTKCNCCGHTPEQLHIGKSSAGWQFSFHSTKDIRSYKQWLEYLKDEVIEDEYGDVVSLEVFKELVKAKSFEDRNHAEYMMADEDGDCDFLDDEGHSFTESDFS